MTTPKKSATKKLTRASTKPDRLSLLKKATASKVLRQEAFGDDEPLSIEESFINGVTKWIQTWADKADEAQCKKMQPGVFVFAEKGEPDKIGPTMEAAPSFRSAFDQDIAGTLHGCTLELKQVFRQKLSFADTSAALAWLQTNCPSYTAVVFSPKTRDALIRRAGRSFDDCDRVPFGLPAGTPFDFAKMDALLKRFHEEWTRTPQAYCRVWAKAKVRKLKTLTEAQIQGSLKAFFDFTVRPQGGVVDEEFATRLGRGDVRIIRVSNNKVIESCIMELKVLFNDKTDSKNTDWALSGITQLLKYRAAEKYPGPSYLCCFDGRNTNADIALVEAEAKKQDIKSRRYFMETPGCT